MPAQGVSDSLLCVTRTIRFGLRQGRDSSQQHARTSHHITSQHRPHDLISCNLPITHSTVLHLTRPSNHTNRDGTASPPCNGQRLVRSKTQHGRRRLPRKPDASLHPTRQPTTSPAIMSLRHHTPEYSTLYYTWQLITWEDITWHRSAWRHITQHKTSHHIKWRRIGLHRMTWHDISQLTKLPHLTSPHNRPHYFIAPCNRPHQNRSPHHHPAPAEGSRARKKTARHACRAQTTPHGHYGRVVLQFPRVERRHSTGICLN